VLPLPPVGLRRPRRRRADQRAGHPAAAATAADTRHRRLRRGPERLPRADRPRVLEPRPMSRRRRQEPAIRRTVSFFDERLSVSRFVRSSLDKVFPDHYAFLLGEIALYCFIVLVLTGIFLTFFFNASSTEVVYHGAYHPLVGAHVSDAYRSTRELNWIVGVTMLILAIFNGFAGYSLPDDLLSGTGLRIAFSIAESIPV